MVKMSSKCFEEVYCDNKHGGVCGKGAPLNGCISKEIYLDKKEGTSFSILWFSPFFYVPCGDAGACGELNRRALYKYIRLLFRRLDIVW